MDWFDYMQASFCFWAWYFLLQYLADSPRRRSLARLSRDMDSLSRKLDEGGESQGPRRIK